MRLRPVLFAGLAVLAILVAAAVYVATADWAGRIETWATNALGREVEIGTARVGWAWPPVVSATDVVVQDGEGEDGDPLARIAGIELQLSVEALFDGVLTYRELRIVDPVLHLPVTPAASGGSRTTGTQSKGGDSGWFRVVAIPERRNELRWLHAFTIEGATLTHAGTGDRFGPLTIEELSFGVTGPRQPVEAAMTGSYADRPVEATVTLGSLGALAGTREPYSARIRIAGRDVEIAFEGTIGEPFAFQGIEGDLRLAGQDIARLGTTFGLSAPYSWPYEARGRLAVGNDAWSFTGVEGTLNGSPFIGRVRSATAEGHPARRIAVDLYLNELDAAALRPDIDAPAGGTGDGGDDVGFIPAVPLPQPQTAGTALMADLRVDRLHLAGRTVGPVNIEGRMTPKGLSVDELRVEMMDGLLAARVVAQPHDGGTRLLLQSGAAGLDPDAVFGAGGEGTMAARIDLVGHGSTLDGLMATLDGRVVAGIEDATVGSGLLRTAATSFGLPTETLGRGETVRLECFIAALDVRQGMAVVDALLLRASGLTFIGDGRILLGQERFDLVIRAALSSTLDLPSVRVTGPFADPRVETLDGTGTGGGQENLAATVPEAVSALLEDPLATFALPGEPVAGIGCPTGSAQDGSARAPEGQ